MIGDLVYRCRIDGPSSGGSGKPAPTPPDSDSHLPRCPFPKDFYQPGPVENGNQTPGQVPNFGAAFK